MKLKDNESSEKKLSSHKAEIEASKKCVGLSSVCNRGKILFLALSFLCATPPSPL